MATVKNNPKLLKYLHYRAPPSSEQLNLEVVHVTPAVPTLAGDEKVFPLVGSDLHARLFVVRLFILILVACMSP